MVPVCAFFLYKTYEKQDEMGDVQVQMQVDMATMKAVQNAQTSVINNLSNDIRDLSRKIDRQDANK